ncbi:MAG: phosphatidate cytidylyltransferase [Pseudomonadota bacterium]
MLKLRVITALVLAPLAIWATLALPGPWFAAMLGVIFVLGAWEWSRLAGLQHVVLRHFYVAVFVGVMIALLNRDTIGYLLFFVAAAGVLWWCVALVLVLRFPHGSTLWKRYPSLVSFAGMLTLLPGWVSLAGLQWHTGPRHALFVMLLIWGADVGAYFAGHAFGRRKLAPQVSPGKTWAGVGGAMASTLVITLIGTPLLGLPLTALSWMLPLALVVVAASIVGDLTESMFKRLAAVKDSGGLLPGHGGVLDRIDSLTAAAPVFVFGFFLWHALS